MIVIAEMFNGLKSVEPSVEPIFIPLTRLCAPLPARLGIQAGIILCALCGKKIQRKYKACLSAVRFLARLNDLQIGQAKATRKSNGYISCFASRAYWTNYIYT